MNKFKKMDIGQEDLLSDLETKELLKKVKTGDKSAKDKLVRHNLRLVLKIAHRLKTDWMQLEEIFQVGTLGLIKAIEKFDLKRKVKFSTYAVPVIIGKIRSYLRDDDQLKVGRLLKQRANQIRQTQSELKKELKREPTIKELSDYLNLTCNQIVRALEAVQHPTSIYQQLYNQAENSVELIDRLADEKDEYEKQINRLDLAKALKKLNPRAKKIIKLRYFADKSQSEIAEIIGVSQAQVSRLEKKILNQIRNEIKD